MRAGGEGGMLHQSKWMLWNGLLGGLSLLALLFSHLALTDIAHGEADLTLEWSVLRVSAGILLAFIISTFLMMRKWSKRSPQLSVDGFPGK
jgi:hypothetical protein